MVGSVSCSVGGLELGQGIVEWGPGHGQVWSKDVPCVVRFLFLLTSDDQGCLFWTDLCLVERRDGPIGGGGGGRGPDRGGVTADVVGGRTRHTSPGTGLSSSSQSLESHLHLLHLRERGGGRRGGGRRRREGGRRGGGWGREGVREVRGREDGGREKGRWSHL